MKISVKIIVKKIIGEYTFAKIKRVYGKIKSGCNDIETKIELDKLSCGYHTTGGYYDHNLVKDGQLLFVTLDANCNKVVNYNYNLFSKENHVIAESNIANWQQGNRLQWIEHNRFIYNDYDGNRYISIELENGNKRIHPWPIYEATSDYAVSLDFSRLGHIRHGYGYTKFKCPKIDRNSIAFTIFSMKDDLETGRVRYDEIVDKLDGSVRLENCYINHISLSPDKDKFLFFFIEKQVNIHKCYLMLYDNDEVIVLDNELSASHYTWRDNSHILVTAYDKERNCRYYLYNTETITRTEVMPEKLKCDGHPTYIAEDVFVTDTYPDKRGYQKIMLVNVRTQEVNELVCIYSTAKHMGERRCDLHPRYDKDTKLVVFDADIKGHRELYYFSLEGHQWLQENEKKN